MNSHASNKSEPPHSLEDRVLHFLGTRSDAESIDRLSDLVELLSPEVIGHKIGELFRKRTPQGAPQFPEIEVVWVLCETHFVEVSLGMKGLPALVLARDRPDSPGPAVAVINGLQPAWAAAHGVPLIEIDSALFDTIRFEKQKSDDSADKPMPRHAIWRRQYRQRPYLRPLDEIKLGQYYQHLIAALTPCFLKGATPEENKRSLELMERFAHFLEEVNERGIDLKKYAPLMQALGKEFTEGKPPAADVAKVEALANTKIQLESGKFYMNALGKNYRCLKVASGTATLVLLDMLMGKSLEVVMDVNEPNWRYYWPITDQALLAALQNRFERFISQHPEFR